MAGVYYSSLKVLHFTDHLEALRQGRVVAPVHIRIKPTNRCNHHCWYCAYQADNLQLGETMRQEDSIPPEKMMEIVADIVAMGVKAVTFSGGGEPLLYKPLPECINRLAAGGVRVATLTNGSNLKGEVAEALARHATWVRVSCDAWDDESFRRSRGGKGNEFSRILENMAAFSQWGSSCVLGVSFVVTRENHRHIGEACALFKQAGAHHVKLSGVVVANEGAENNRYHGEIREEVGRQIDQAMALNDARFALVNHYHRQAECFERSYRQCPYLQFLTIIGADCQVYTCQDKAYTVAGRLGSIRERSFREFWFSEENREKLFRLDPSQQCHHHCVTHERNLTILEYLGVDPEHGFFV